MRSKTEWPVSSVRHMGAEGGCGNKNARNNERVLTYFGTDNNGVTVPIPIIAIPPTFRKLGRKILYYKSNIGVVMTNALLRDFLLRDVSINLKA